MRPKIIKTEAEYEAALERINQLMEAAPGTEEGDDLELFVRLVEDYEQQNYPVDLPDAISAILFRMEQQGLTQKDLVEFIGSKSKVSEVLAGKRPLSLNMIRKLHEGLGIPAGVLLQDAKAKLPKIPEGLDWNLFPIKEMFKRQWLDFSGSLPEAKDQTEELLSTWAAPLGDNALQPTFMRQHVRGRSGSKLYSLAAWRIRVSLLAMAQKIPAYVSGNVTPDFVRDLVKLSYLENGPLLAKEFLMKNGIHVVVEPHLPGTHLDGAVMFLQTGAPVIALTLRYDRLDYFWFTLCHELAHLVLHLGSDKQEQFYDDLDSLGDNDFEGEADRWASVALIPDEQWRASGLNGNCSAEAIVAFADKHRIHSAIPAGRIRREQKNYKKFYKLIGNGELRKQFMPSR
jgi:HTH-type transcriptional regulator/antitoxin HigA